MTSPEAPFDALCEPRAGALEVPDQWQQGRGTFGGLITAAMIRALEQAAPSRALRSLTAELCGPVQPGRAALSTRVLRAGNAVTTATAEVLQGAEVQAHGVGVLGNDRLRDRDQVQLAPPSPPPWERVEVVPVEPPFAPVFAQHVEFRPTGPLPMSGASRAEVEGWVRFRRPGARADAAWLAGLVDCYWPALFMVEAAPRPMATIAFTFQPMTPALEGLRADVPVFYRARLVAVDRGYCVEDRELWSAEGRLLALNRQTFVIIK